MIATLKTLGCDWMMAVRKTNLVDAKISARSGNNIRLVVMGCDGLYWVVSARDAGKLRKAGYETV